MTDFFDSGPAVAAFSWDGMAKGTTVTGILAQPHETSQQTDIEGNPRFFDAEKTQPIMQAVLTLATDYRKFEYTSEVFRDRATKDDVEDDGLRKLYVRGSLKTPSLNKGLREAMRKAGVKAPEVGATIAVTFVRKQPVPDTNFKQNVFEVSYTRPTPETLAKVAEHAKEPAMAGGPATEDHDDDSMPPF